MGRIHIESFVSTTTESIKREREEAKHKIIQAVKAAHKDDPTFFRIPHNPFVSSRNTLSSSSSSYIDTDRASSHSIYLGQNQFSDAESEEDAESRDKEELRAKIWFTEMKKAATISPTARTILSIRRELCQKVQQELDELKAHTNLDFCMNTSPIFQELYCHLLQLEHFLFHL
eukprot:TRINITY_DN153_c0_g1_i2.p1 TRINITY_DN153_c0_g1~~TRINITY_DN153_c0_g1_i2.p1  ORF type:complete len:173 (-),score=41.04 TRINITY_DN153_c0_g1_i2:44-562(-)